MSCVLENKQSRIEQEGYFRGLRAEPRLNILKLTYKKKVLYVVKLEIIFICISLIFMNAILFTEFYLI